jgi:hypothetical protein
MLTKLPPYLKQFQEPILRIIGEFIDDLKAFDKRNLLTVNKTDENSWSIANAKALAYLSR